MSQTNITNTSLAVGEPWSSSKSIAFNDAINDNDTRLTAVEGTTSRVQVMNDAVTGFIDQYTVAEIGSFQTFQAPINMTLTTFQFTITDNVDNANNADATIPAETTAAGVLELVLELYNNSTQTWSSILSVNPRIDVGLSGRGTQSNNATFSTSAITLGQYIRIRPISFKDRQGSFHVQCTAEAT